MAQTNASDKEKAGVKPSEPLVVVNKVNKPDFLHQYILSKVDYKKQSTVAKINNDNLYNSRILKTNKEEPKSDKSDKSFASDMVGWLKDKYSLMIDVMPDQISNVMLYRFIDDWYGVRYRMGGTTKKGVDCSAFVQHLYKYVFGMSLLRTACLQFQSAEYIKSKSDLKEGDLVFFRIGTSRISHVGVYLRNNFFVHSASSKGVSIANLTNAYWSKYFAGGGRIIQ